MNDKIKEEMTKRAVNGRLSCAVARKIAEEFAIPYKEIGNAANELGIKIADCQLGCF